VKPKAADWGKAGAKAKAKAATNRAVKALAKDPWADSDDSDGAPPKPALNKAGVGSSGLVKVTAKARPKAKVTAKAKVAAKAKATGGVPNAGNRHKDPWDNSDTSSEEEATPAKAKAAAVPTRRKSEVLTSNKPAPAKSKKSLTAPELHAKASPARNPATAAKNAETKGPATQAFGAVAGVASAGAAGAAAAAGVAAAGGAAADAAAAAGRMATAATGAAASAATTSKTAASATAAGAVASAAATGAAASAGASSTSTAPPLATTSELLAASADSATSEPPLPPPPSSPRTSVKDTAMERPKTRESAASRQSFIPERRIDPTLEDRALTWDEYMSEHKELDDDQLLANWKELKIVEDQAAEEDNEALRAELESLSMKEIKAIAREAGLTEDNIEDAEEEEKPKLALIDMILTKKQGGDIKRPSQKRGRITRLLDGAATSRLARGPLRAGRGAAYVATKTATVALVAARPVARVAGGTARVVGGTAKKGAVLAGRGAKVGALATARGAKAGALATARGAKAAGSATYEGAKKAGATTKQAAEALKNGIPRGEMPAVPGAKMAREKIAETAEKASEKAKAAKKAATANRDRKRERFNEAVKAQSIDPW